MEKNVLIVLDKLISGGAQNVAVNLAIHLSKVYKYHVKIAVFENNADKSIENVEIIDLKLGKSKSVLSKIINVIKRIIKLKKIKKEYQITHSISFLTVPNFVNCMSKNKEKIIISIRNEMSKLEKDNISTYMNKIAGKVSDTIVPVSNYILKDEQENYKIDPGKMKVIYNFCDKEKIIKLAQEEVDIEYQKIFENNRVMIHVGRLEKQKGQEKLIREFKEVTNKIDNIVLFILGEGSERKNLEKIIRELNLEEKVYLLGYQKNPYKYMKLSKGLVLTSLFEGMPNVVLEAMALGVPVISTDCNPGIREILEEKPKDDVVEQILYSDYGVIIPNCQRTDNENELSNQEKYISKAICDLITNETMLERYSRKGLERIEKFSIESILPKWQEVLSK